MSKRNIDAGQLKEPRRKSKTLVEFLNNEKSKWFKQRNEASIDTKAKKLQDIIDIIDKEKLGDNYGTIMNHLERLPFFDDKDFAFFKEWYINYLDDQGKDHQDLGVVDD